MCINSLMIDTDIIQCLIEELLDRICVINSSSPIILSPTLYSSKFIENKFNQSMNILNNSIKQLLTYELNTVVHNGQLTTTTSSNTRHSRYYNPATTIKQTNDLKKRLHWIEQRQLILKQLNINQNHKRNETNSVLNPLESIWFDHRFKMLDNSLELLKKEEKTNEVNDDSSCSRCRIYQRKKQFDSQLMKKLKYIHQINIEHNYSTIQSDNTTPESDLIFSLSKIADRIGHTSNLNVSNPLKKLPSSSTTTIKKKQHPKLQSSISLFVGDSNKNTKRTIEESRIISNSNFITTNFDLTNKRQKRIASPLPSLSVSSTGTTGPVSSSSPHEILTPTWRTLTTGDFETPLNIEKSSDQQENEDINDDAYIHRHIRCELEQESWVTNPQTSTNVSLTSNRKSGTLQTSLSVPNGLSTTNSKQYRYRLTPNGIAYTETIDTK